GRVVEPVLPAPGIVVVPRLARLCEPVRALPPADLAEDGALGIELRMERRAAHASSGRLLAIGEMVGIEQAERLLRAFVKVVPVALEGLVAADIDVAEVEGLLARLHPFGERHAGAPGRLDADGVEAGR